MRTLAVIAASTAACASAQGQSGSAFVDARSNIFGYGVGTPSPGGGGGGLVAPVVALTPGAGRVLTVGASGMAGWSGGLNNGPDGGTFHTSTTIAGVGPVSGFAAPLSGHLVGLFIESGDISGLPAPGELSYPDLASLGAPSYAPELRQVFFIGDGLTGTGTGDVQTFTVPDGAGMLVLGIADAFGFSGLAGYYDDNVGGYDATYTVVPSPAAAAGVVIGCGLLWRRRRA